MNRSDYLAQRDIMREKAKEEALMRDPSKKQMQSEMIKTKSQKALETFRRPAYAYTYACKKEK